MNSTTKSPAESQELRPIQPGSRKERKILETQYAATRLLARLIASQGPEGLKKVVAQATAARAQCRWAHASHLYAIAAAAVPPNTNRTDAQQIGLERWATICASLAAPGPSKKDRANQMAAVGAQI